jgi:steroid delta-isomerase-like uncharacterized protein
MSAENKALVCRLIEEVQNQHHLDRLDEFFAPDFINHLDHRGDSSELNSVEKTRLFFRAFIAAFPDLHVTIHNQLAEADKVVTHKTFHGTHQGEFMGLPPTGKQIALEIIDILRLANGKVVEHWAVRDQMGMMQQLGLVPTSDQS